MNNYEDVVVSTRVRLARNFKTIPFPAKLHGSTESANKVIDSVVKVCDKLYDYKLLRMNELNDVDRVALLERHLISPNLVENTDNGAVIIAKNNGVSIMINEEDHIRAQCVMKGYGLEECYDIISRFDDELASTNELAFDNKLGYLTACPTNLGTGMRASVMLFLPALTHTGDINRVINDAGQLGLTVRGMYGEGSSAKGYLYQVSNQITIGTSEKDLLQNVASFVEKLCDAEKSTRVKWYKNAGINLEDKIMRAYGILLYARSISSKEFMEHIAFVKLGVALKILDLDMTMLNTLTELCQPANLCHHEGRKIGEVERDQARAKLVRENINKRRENK